MGHPFQHPSSNRLLDRMAQLFRSGNVKLSRRRHLVFVCGGGTNIGDNSFRRKFLTYAERNLKDYDVFRAETAAKDIDHYDDPKFVNIANFEEVLAGIADCIVIFPESAGSYAEVGYFSKNAVATSKILIANPRKYYSKPSFLNQGPIELINAVSAFRPSIPVFGISKPDFSEISLRIRGKLPPKTNRTLNLKPYNEYTHKEKFIIMLNIIWLLWICETESLHYVMNVIFDGYEEDEGRILLATLLACNYVQRVEEADEFFVVSSSEPVFVEIAKTEIGKLKTRLRSHYHVHAPTYDEIINRVFT